MALFNSIADMQAHQTGMKIVGADGKLKVVPWNGTDPNPAASYNWLPGERNFTPQELAAQEAYGRSNEGSDTFGNLLMPALMAGVGGLAFSGAGLGGLGDAGSLGGGSSFGAQIPGEFGASGASAAGGGMDFNPIDWGMEDTATWPGSDTFASPNNFFSSTPGDVPVGGDPASSLFGSSNLPPGASNLMKLLGLGGSGTGPNLLNAIPGLLGALGANSQANALQNIANQARSDRQPFLDYSKNLLAGGPEAYAAGPGGSALKGVLQKLSATNGNPLGSGTSMQLATDAAGANWQNAVTGFGNLGLGGQATQIGAATNAANAGANTLNSLGAAASDVINPKSDLSTLLAAALKNGGNLNLSGLGLT